MLDPELLNQANRPFHCAVSIFIDMDMTVQTGENQFDPLMYDLECQRCLSGSNAWATVDMVSSKNIPIGGFIWLDTSLPLNTNVYTYRFRQVSTMVGESAWTNPVVASPRQVFDSTIPQNYKQLALFAAQTVDEDGTTLRDDVRMMELNVARRLNVGTQKGEAKDGANIGFNPAFKATPKFTFRGGIMHQPESKWGTFLNARNFTATGSYLSTVTTYEDVQADSVTATGFQLRAMLYQATPGAALSGSFPAGTKTLSGIGNSTFITVSGSAASDGKYTVNGTTTIDDTGRRKAGQIASVVLVIEDDASGQWQTRDTVTLETEWISDGSPDGYEAFEVIPWSRSFTNPAMTVGGNVRVTLVDRNCRQTTVMDQTKWNTLSGIQYTSKTPGSQVVYWEATGYQ